MAATCPVCGEFEGAPQSVEAHISGSTTGAHQGALGEEYRGALSGAGSRLWKLLAIAGVIAVLTIAENVSDGGSSEPEEQGEEGGTMLVDPASLAHEGARR